MKKKLSDDDDVIFGCGIKRVSDNTLNILFIMKKENMSLREHFWSLVVGVLTIMRTMGYMGAVIFISIGLFYNSFTSVVIGLVSLGINMVIDRISKLRNQYSNRQY